jgi:hypothetical protein
MIMKNLNLLENTFRSMLKNAPAFAEAASRRQADAS